MNESLTEEHRRNISLAHKGKPKNEEWRRKIGIAVSATKRRENQLMYKFDFILEDGIPFPTGRTKANLLRAALEKTFADMQPGQSFVLDNHCFRFTRKWCVEQGIKLCWQRILDAEGKKANQRRMWLVSRGETSAFPKVHPKEAAHENEMHNRAIA